MALAQDRFANRGILTLFSEKRLFDRPPRFLPTDNHNIVAELTGNRKAGGWPPGRCLGETAQPSWEVFVLCGTATASTLP